MTERMTNLDTERYGTFIRTLSVLKESCNDIVFSNGIIRQRSTDVSSIFEIDVTSLIGDLSFVISNIKEKIDLLKSFLEQEVRIEVDDQGVTLADDDSVYKIVHPDRNYLDNKFMEETEFNNLVSINEENLLSTHSINPKISERMKIFSAGFHVNSFQMVFEGEFSSIRSRTMSKDQGIKIIGNLMLNEQITGSANLITTPYICDHDGDIVCKIYKIGERCICKYSMFIGNIPVVIYTRCEIKTG
jgi:hypothetical protein